jgi:NitT/TauT family transport system ATP-binding protein
MDEPFGALDALTRDQLNVDLQRIFTERRKTVVLVTHSISEAIFLSDRVFVMSQRPGTVEDILTIDLPRPRRLAIRESAEFGAYVRQVREIFEATGVLIEE